MKTIMATCPECSATWSDEGTCQEYFHQMLFWEAESPRLGEVHHLMVLSYYLQHPSLYSPDGLAEGRRLLVEFVERGATPAEVRRHNRGRLDSSQRKWKIKATPDSHGAYPRPVKWTMTAADVVAGGPEKYRDNVRGWAQTIHAALKAQ